MRIARTLKTQFIFPLMTIVCCLMAILYFFFDDFFLVFFSFTILFLVTIPLLLKNKIDVFSIWSWIFYSSILGVLLRCLYIFFDMPDYNEIDTVFLMGKPKSFLFPAMLLIFGGVFTMVLGYISTNKKLKLKSKIIQNDTWSEKRFVRLTLILLIISNCGLVLFINAQGGLFSLESISSYRGVSDTLSEASPHSYLRLLVSFSGLNLFLLTTWLIRYNTRRIFVRTLWFISFLTFIFFNFYISQRGAIVFTLVQLTAVSYYIKGFKLPKLKLFVGLVFALTIFQVMSVLRGVKDVENQDVKLSITKALEPAILTTNMIDVSKTAHIINAIPGKLNYEYGATLVTIFIAWIPREFWPNKPVTNVDNTIGIEVYGASTYGSGGVPPGIIAELYWNFWIPGVLIGCFLLGAILKIIDQTILANILNPNVVILFVVNFMFIGLAFVGSSFSSVLIGVLQTLIPLVIILNVITEKKI
jgi:oligosaccharide repeat unit polymerase